MGQPLSKELRQFARLHIREHCFLFDVLQIFGQQVHHPMSNFAKFPGFHESTWYFILMQGFLKILIDRERNRHAEIAAWRQSKARGHRRWFRCYRDPVLHQIENVTL